MMRGRNIQWEDEISQSMTGSPLISRCGLSGRGHEIKLVTIRPDGFTLTVCSRVLMESPPESEEERRLLLETIAQSTEMTNRLIEDLLDVSMIESGRLSIEKRSEDVAPIVEHVVLMFAGLARERGIKLYEDVAPGLPLVMCRQTSKPPHGADWVTMRY